MKRMELYIHIPFCKQKCAYCDFLSAPADYLTQCKYLTKLQDEMAFYKDAYAEYEVDTVFFGGGTPSILEIRHIEELMSKVKECFNILPNAEISMECNPGTVSAKKAQAMYNSGINRVSIGLQSANNIELAMLGRIHTWEQFLQSFDHIRKAGFYNVNIDLMSALPGQTLKTWETTLKNVLALRPEHISAYSLIIEEGTQFWDIYQQDMILRDKGKQPRLLPSEDVERQMYYMTERMLAQKGFIHYEISNYAKPGYECLHNIGYWTRKNYLGLGLGASSMIENVRFQNTSDLKEYLLRPFAHENEMVLELKDQMEEYMFLGLRMANGVSRGDFYRLFHVEIERIYGDVLKKLGQQGLLTTREGRICLTNQGIDVSNRVMAEFLL